MDELSGRERNEIAARNREQRALERLAATGRERISEWESGASAWCVECGDAVNDRGRDSWGECADDGEDVWWVRHRVRGFGS